MTWTLVKASDMNEVSSFLLQREWECVTLTGRLLASGKLRLPDAKQATLLKAEGDGAGLSGIVYFSAYGLALPVFDGLRAAADLRDLQELRSKNGVMIQSLVGTSRSVNLLTAGLSLGSSVSIDYHLMRTEGKELPFDGIELPEITVRKAEKDEAEALMPLQEAYEREEVLIRQEYFDPQKSLAEVRANLSNQLFYVAEHRGTIVAKGGTNARGLGFDQIGGVYTKPEWRNRKIGHALVRAILENIFRDGKEACLFVKKANAPALRLYSRLGFRVVDDFNIRYFRV